MKKTVISIITFICLLVGVLSFSLPVMAASETYVKGDVFFYTGQTSNSALTVTMKDDGSYTGTSAGCEYSAYIYSGINQSQQFLGKTVKFYLASTIPANSRIHVCMGVKFWAANGNKNASSLDFRKYHCSFNNPAAYDAASARWTVRQYTREGQYSKEAFFDLYVDTLAPVSSLDFYDVGATVSVSGTESTYKMWLYLMDCRVSYTPINDNPNGDVLKDIRSNTNNTTNAVNNQTTTITNNIKNQTDTMTNGYDNSSMTDDNTRLNNQIAQYDAAQESATNTSVSNIDAAEFVNPSSNASVFAAMTFSASFLQSLYNNLGDFSIVIMVSLSLCLGLMLVGWFKYRKGG